MSEEIKCTWCDEVLDDEARESPYHDDSGDVICDRCHTKHFEGVCDLCGDVVNKDELKMRPGEILAFFEETDGLQPGYYRVIRWPIYADGMTEGYVMTENIQFVAPLDDAGKRAAEEAWTPGGSLCEDCRKSVESRLIGKEGVTR